MLKIFVIVELLGIQLDDRLKSKNHIGNIFRLDAN